MKKAAIAVLFLAGAVVEDAVDVLDLVDDAAGDGLEQAPRNLGGFGRHEIGGGRR